MRTIWDEILGSNWPDFWMTAFSNIERFHLTSCIHEELSEMLDHHPRDGDFIPKSADRVLVINAKLCENRLNSSNETVDRNCTTMVGNISIRTLAFGPERGGDRQ
jgi:hypothetical protein